MYAGRQMQRLGIRKGGEESAPERREFFLGRRAARYSYAVNSVRSSSRTTHRNRVMDHHALRCLTVAVFALTAVALNVPWGKLFARLVRLRSSPGPSQVERAHPLRPPRLRQGRIAGRLVPARKR
jgi:hypothetical protein